MKHLVQTTLLTVLISASVAPGAAQEPGTPAQSSDRRQAERERKEQERKRKAEEKEAQRQAGVRCARLHRKTTE